MQMICRTCGVIFAGSLADGATTEADKPCERCGATPCFVDVLAEPEPEPKKSIFGKKGSEK
jgi:hypothetical protein